MLSEFKRAAQQFDLVAVYAAALSCLAHLSPDIVIHRVTGDGPKDLLIAPKWSLDKRKVLNSLHHRMKEQGIRQGDLYEAINKDKH